LIVAIFGAVALFGGRLEAQQDFVRGDADINGALEVSDPIALLNFLFLGIGNIPCRDAGDVDDSGEENLTDAVFLLNYLFLGGPEPASPFPSCGLDPTDKDALDCQEYPHCDIEPTEYDRVVAMYGNLETLAGTGLVPDNNLNLWQERFENGSATAAELSRPHTAMADRKGNVYIADKGSHGIRRVTPDGTISTYAGTNVPGDDGDDPGPATEGRLNNPNGLWVRDDGTLYILDTGNGKVRRVDISGQMTTMFSVPGGIIVGRGLWVSDDEDLAFVSSLNTLYRWTPEDGAEAVAFSTGYNQLGNIAMSPDGEIYVTDKEDLLVYVVDEDGERTVVAGNGLASGGGDGELAIETGLNEPRGIFFHPLGGYFIAEHNGSRVWYVDTSEVIHLFVNGRNGSHCCDGEPFNSPGNKLSEVRNVTVDFDGNVLITENDAGYVRIVRRVGA
jgi:sugar lactone lactonase YvrE